jgi:UDP-N-acetyl-D-glucosamine 4,6-dehydratase
MQYSKKFTKHINLFFKDHKIFKDQFNNKGIFKNKTIAITGGAGSIGSLLALKLLTFQVKKIVVIDNNEYSIFKLRQLINKKDKKKIDIKFLSILNTKQLEKNFKQYKFDYLYNCAAIKHVDIAEENKEETYRVNVQGTLKLLQLAKKYKVKKFIFISSDKAFYPKGVMGKTKFLAEKKIINYKANFEKKILRFPNVITSSGSILEIINDCIINKKTFYLKHKNLSRFFIFKTDTLEFILRATNLPVRNKIIVLSRVKEAKIIDLINYISKHFALTYQVSRLPKFEKVSENYSDFKNKVFI